MVGVVPLAIYTFWDVGIILAFEATNFRREALSVFLGALSNCYLANRKLLCSLYTQSGYEALELIVDADKYGLPEEKIYICHMWGNS